MKTIYILAHILYNNFSALIFMVARDQYKYTIFHLEVLGLDKNHKDYKILQRLTGVYIKRSMEGKK